MKIRAIIDQDYYTYNGMAITTGNVYDVIEAAGNIYVVRDDTGGSTYIFTDECMLEEE